MKTLTVWLPNKTVAYIEGKEGVTEIKAFTIGGYFQYWQVVFTDNHWLDITAPCILEHKPRNSSE